MVKIHVSLKYQSYNHLCKSFADTHVCVSVYLPLKKRKLVNGIKFQNILIF